MERADKHPKSTKFGRQNPITERWNNDEQPTVHEGVEARAMERKGFVSDRCELNRQIKADNTLLRELKAQSDGLDPVELFRARENLRNECEEFAESRIRTPSKSVNFWDITSARSTVDRKLDLYSEEQRVKRILRERNQREREQPQQKKPSVNQQVFIGV